MRWLLLFLLPLLLAEPALAQQPSNACRIACRVGQGNPTPDQRQCLAQCAAGQPITRDQAGQARPSGRPAVTAAPSLPPPAPSAAPPPPSRAAAGAPPPPPPSRAAPGGPPPPSAARAAAGAPPPPASRATASPAPPGQPPQPPPGRPGAASFGAVYLAIPPNMGYGMAIGQRDRLTAHRVAENACRAAGANCVMAEDLREPCAAVAEGVRRAPGAFFMTSDPKTYVVRAITFRSAGNRADAEREALDVCRQRERGLLTCRIVQAQCAG